MGKGVTHLLDAINKLIPDSLEEEQGLLPELIFKISHDAQMGKTAYVRLYSGTLRNRDSVVNATKGVQEKISQIRKFYGEKYVDTGHPEGWRYCRRIWDAKCLRWGCFGRSCPCS